MSEAAAIGRRRARARRRPDAADADCAAAEEPLEIRLHGQPFAVIMRTPGADRELAAGFLLSKRVSPAPTISARSRTAPTHAMIREFVNVTLATDRPPADRAAARGADGR